MPNCDSFADYILSDIDLIDTPTVKAYESSDEIQDTAKILIEAPENSSAKASIKRLNAVNLSRELRLLQKSASIGEIITLTAQI